jgi:Arc/MetJ-type ribon-helix-helix transcriptional regulator
MKSMDKKERKYTTITIPLPLFKKLRDKIEGTGFSSVSDCVTYILRETLVEMESKDLKDKNRNAVVEKLKALGYTM